MCQGFLPNKIHPRPKCSGIFQHEVYNRSNHDQDFSQSNFVENLGFEKYGFGRRAHMATVTQCWRRRWKRCDSYVTAVVAPADAEVKPSSSVASLGALPKHIHCKPGIEPLLHPVFLKYVQLYLSRATECIIHHLISIFLNFYQMIPWCRYADGNVYPFICTAWIQTQICTYVSRRRSRMRMMMI